MAKKERQPKTLEKQESQLSEDERGHMMGTIHICQRVLHGLTGVMIGAFALIVLFTTISSGPFVQVTGRGLYFLILAAAVTSLVTWIVRVRMEKRLGNETHVVADIMKRV